MQVMHALRQAAEEELIPNEVPELKVKPDLISIHLNLNPFKSKPIQIKRVSKQIKFPHI